MDRAETTRLELSGLRLDSAPGRKETESSFSSSPEEQLPPSRVPLSPTSHLAAHKGVSKPPGLGPLPSPITKMGGHSKSTSATSPLLSLTPNSSVDGTQDWGSIGRQSSPFHPVDAPAMPFLGAKPPSDHGSLGSVDEAGNDGLLGLEHAFSPRGHFQAHVGRERPPLSQSGHEVFPGDRSVQSVHSAGSGSSLPGRSATDVSFESGFGAIRPELRPAAAEYDPSRRRASSTDAAPYYDPNLAKFGHLPTLSSHIHQQRHPYPNSPTDLGELPKPRHVRSISQPMQHQMGHDSSRFYPSHGYHPDHRSMRSTSVTYQTSSSYDNKRAPAGYTGYPPLQRRDALDFQLSPNSQADSAGMASSHDSMFVHHQVHYASHSRQPSDALSNSSMGSLHRSQSASYARHAMRSEEDLAHPLVGEHIEVPDERYRGSYLSQSMPTLSHPLMRMPQDPHFHPMESAPAIHPVALPKVIYTVKFKRSQRNFVLGPRISRDLKIGTYVKVEADRGEDLGIVVGKLPADKFSFSARSYSAGLGPAPGLGAGGMAGMGAGGMGDLKRIIRLATHDEVSLLSPKREEEDELLKICRSKVRQRGLPMHVVDAEYQFDRHKLTFFFEAEGRVDFRELVRDLFSMYKTRIWMQQLDKNTSTSMPAMISPPTSSLEMDVGTPIIAPTSEFADAVVFNEDHDRGI